jgi:moderate conductance mechanosensitive channel
MTDWLDGLIPAGSSHAILVQTAEAGLKIVLTLLAFIVLRWLAVRAISLLMLPLRLRAEKQDESHAGRLRTLQSLAASAISYVLLFLAVVTVLGEIGVNVAALVASAGVAGLALTFGAQRMVRDVLAGFFMLLEDQFRVGEYVTLVGGPGLPQLTGTIQEIGLRITRMVDSAGKYVVIGNGDIAAVINHSRGPVAAAVEIGVPPDTSLDTLQELVAPLEPDPERFSGSITVRGVSALDAGKMLVRFEAPSRPGQTLEAELALRREVGDALRKAGIELR